MTQLTKIQACHNHLLLLFQALKKGDVRSIYKIEHELTPTEECVACAYALKAKGEVRDTLYEFLESQGLLVGSVRKNYSEAEYWLFRILVFAGVFIMVVLVALFFRLLLFGQGPALNFSSFGWFGTFILSLGIFTLLEYWIYPD